MKPLHARVRAARSQAGFSMVEILVGLVIAMVGVAIMMEVLLTSEQRTRTTTGGNEALTSGAVMMHLMQRDLLQAGFGINAQRLLATGCSVELRTGIVVPLAPVVINPRRPDAPTVPGAPPPLLLPAGDPNTDTLLVFYGSDNGQPEGHEVLDTSGGTYAVRAGNSFRISDYVVAAPTLCNSSVRLAQVVQPPTATRVTVDVFNAAATALYNMGPQPRVVAYAVRNGALTSCDFMLADCRNPGAQWTAVAADIVSLRAQYGHDTAPAGGADGVDKWDQDTPTDACGWTRTTAVRLVLVARSSQYESQIDDATKQRVCEPVTPAPRAWSGSEAAPGNVVTPIDLSANPDWQCYRYRQFETVAPSRNIVWMRPQAC